MRATLIQRYKRFLADVRLDDGRLVTVHCPNTGSMKNCIEAGAEVWLSSSDNPRRKYGYTWEFIRTARGHFIGVNTGRANQLVADAVRRDLIGELAGYTQLRREVRYGHEKSRVDLQLSGPGRPDCYVEVKSVTLLEDPADKGIGCFPDAVSVRGARHLRELMQMSREGFRSVLFFCVQHTGIDEVRPADHIDPRYGELLREADKQGVEILACKVRKSSAGFRLGRPVPVNL